MTHIGTRCLTLSEDALVRFGQSLAPLLRAGDTLLLTGEIGAGKSVLSRSIIQSLLPFPEDVPSPTFTLVQTYEIGSFDIWHCDLYRLTDISQIDELGLSDAFEAEVCIVEWPQILGDFAPKDALQITIEPTQTQGFRTITIQNPTSDWAQRLDFLNAA